MSFFSKQILPGSKEEHAVLTCSVIWGGLLLLADQWTKVVVENSFAKYESVPVISNFFSLTYVTNRGAAWSMLEGQTWLLLLVAAGVSVAAIWFMRRLTDGWVERYIALFTVLSGVAGNSIDRIWRGAVVDFLDVYLVWGGKAHHWPIFNVADCAICIGVGIFFLSTLLRPAPKEESAESSSDDMETGGDQ